MAAPVGDYRGPSFVLLPVGPTECIFEFLDAKSCMEARVCKAWLALQRSNPTFWTGILRREFPEVPEGSAERDVRFCAGCTPLVNSYSPRPRLLGRVNWITHELRRVPWEKSSERSLEEELNSIGAIAYCASVHRQMPGNSIIVYNGVVGGSVNGVRTFMKLSNGTGCFTAAPCHFVGQECVAFSEAHAGYSSRIPWATILQMTRFHVVGIGQREAEIIKREGVSLDQIHKCLRD